MNTTTLNPSTNNFIRGNRSPRILYLTPFRPHKTSIGSEVRSLHVLRALQQIGKVEVAVLHDEGAAINPNGNYLHDHTLEVKPRLNKKFSEKVKWIFDPRSAFPHGCGVDDAAARQLLRHAREFDLIWFFKLRTPNLFSQPEWPCSVVDIDDVPSTYEETTSQNESGMQQRFQARLRKFSWIRREKILGERFNVLSVCSEGDKHYLRNLGVDAPIHVIPNGFEKPIAEPLRKPTTPPRIGFIGLFDYFPNREGIHWFVNNCWARIKRAIPDARLRLVGRGSDGEHKPSGADIDALGWLENTSDEIATWSATVVPIRVGAGTRVKIAQSFSQKCPIVSTSLGAYGYDAVNEREMFLADSPDAFADACIKAIRQPEQAAQMAERAWQQFLEKWTWDSIHPRIWATAEEGLRSGHFFKNCA